MTDVIKQTLRDSKSARWTALIILSFTMFAGYLFTEVISPLKPILERTYGWNSADFGTVTSAYGLFNVFFLMLIIVGVLLDRFGIRFSTVASVLIMIIGGSIKYYAFKVGFNPESEILGIKTQIFLASFGYALFGVGVEYAGITVSKSVVKWFMGKEMALAMGMQVAIARIGSFVPLAFGAKLAKSTDVPTTILIGVIMLIIGLIAFFYYNTLDRKLDKQIGEQKSADEEEDKFKLSDLKVIMQNRGFWYIAFLCVLFYSAVFPFYKYGPDLMVNKFGVSEDWAGLLPSLVPFGTMLLTPFFGSIYDKKGKGATIMIFGAVLLILVHIIFYLPFVTSVVIAFFNVIILGIAFSLVPSAMWPSVPKIIPEKQLGSAYAAIFWVQNFGLWGIPLLVGVVLNATNPTIAPNKNTIQESFVSAYIKQVEASPLKDAKDVKGETVNAHDIELYAKYAAGDLVNKIVEISDVEEGAEVDTAQLRQEVYQLTENAISSFITNNLDKATLVKVNDDEKNLAFAKMNEALISRLSEVVSAKKIKLNYNYTTTWSIFVALTLVALIVSFLLKREDRIKGYGLELPNIKEEKKE